MRKVILTVALLMCASCALKKSQQPQSSQELAGGSIDVVKAESIQPSLADVPLKRASLVRFKPLDEPRAETTPDLNLLVPLASYRPLQPSFVAEGSADSQAVKSIVEFVPATSEVDEEQDARPPLPSDIPELNELKEIQLRGQLAMPKVQTPAKRMKASGLSPFWINFALFVSLAFVFFLILWIRLDRDLKGPNIPQ